jgi:hypothetical protein
MAAPAEARACFGPAWGGGVGFGHDDTGYYGGYIAPDGSYAFIEGEYEPGDQGVGAGAGTGGASAFVGVGPRPRYHGAFEVCVEIP